ncbi:MAG: hypothetical protein AcusKO_13710 [Acuticoccus sp.]
MVGADEDKKRRLGEALRQNLKRRKAAAKVRRESVADDSATDSGQAGPAGGNTPLSPREED